MKKDIGCELLSNTLRIRCKLNNVIFFLVHLFSFFNLSATYKSLDEYVKVIIDAYADLILQNNMVCLSERIQSELLLLYIVWIKRVCIPYLLFLFSALLLTFLRDNEADMDL